MTIDTVMLIITSLSLWFLARLWHACKKPIPSLSVRFLAFSIGDGIIQPPMDARGDCFVSSPAGRFQGEAEA